MMIDSIDPYCRWRRGVKASMELRHLRYFAALADELSFTRAAEKVHVTQSTLSHQIKQLETELGHRLFEREGKRVIMTEAGEGLLANVTKILREIDESVRTVRGVGNAVTGVLRIASTPTFSASLLPHCFKMFIAKHPGVRVVLTETLAGQVEKLVEDGVIDLGIGYLPAARNAFTFEPLYIEELMLVVSDQHPLAARKRLRLAELHREALVLNTPESATRRMLDERFASVRAEPVVVAEIDAIHPMLALIRATRIGGIVSEHSLGDLTGLQAVALEDPTPLRTPGIIWAPDRARSAACRSFVSIVRATVARANVKSPGRFRQRGASL